MEITVILKNIISYLFSYHFICHILSLGWFRRPLPRLPGPMWRPSLGPPPRGFMGFQVYPLKTIGPPANVKIWGFEDGKTKGTLYGIRRKKKGP